MRLASNDADYDTLLKGKARDGVIISIRYSSLSITCGVSLRASKPIDVKMGPIERVGIKSGPNDEALAGRSIDIAVPFLHRREERYAMSWYGGSVSRYFSDGVLESSMNSIMSIDPAFGDFDGI